jgi:hypothetical protein
VSSEEHAVEIVRERLAPRPSAMERIVQGLHVHGREHAVRYAEYPTPVVLVGMGVWAQLRRDMHSMPGMMIGHFDGLDKMTVMAPGGKSAQVFRTEQLPPMEWKILTDLNIGGTLE